MHIETKKTNIRIRHGTPPGKTGGPHQDGRGYSFSGYCYRHIYGLGQSDIVFIPVEVFEQTVKHSHELVKTTSQSDSGGPTRSTPGTRVLLISTFSAYPKISPDSSCSKSSWVHTNTVIPNLTNPQSLNRFSYAYNNPIKYIDPSGHVPWGENEDDICLPGSRCHPGTSNFDAKREGPSDLDQNLLSNEKSSMTMISGLDFYKWYLGIWEQDGWWWDIFGIDGNFTIKDAMAAIVIFEWYHNWNATDEEDRVLTAELTAEALDRFIAYRIHGSEPGEWTVEQYVNIFAWFADSAEGYVAYGSEFRTPSRSDFWIPHDGAGWARTVAMSILNPEVIGGQYDGTKPYGWGHGGDNGFSFITDSVNTDPGTFYYDIGDSKALIPSGYLYHRIYPE